MSAEGRYDPSLFGTRKRLADPAPPKETGAFKFWRVGYGAVTNFPHKVVVHSPTGMNWGYGGSGPADCALNVLEYAIGNKKEWRAWPRILVHGKVSCYEVAWDLHQSFKWEWIATMPSEGGTIELAVVEKWIEERVKNESK